MSISSEFSVGDWVAVYGAILSSIIAIVEVVRFFGGLIARRSEIKKFETDLYLIQKVDEKSKTVDPIVAVLLANLGAQRISIKSVMFDCVSKNGVKSSGSCGWYEQPDEMYGRRNRLLPCVLESGQTADLPMLYIDLFRDKKMLRIWLTDFNNRKIFIDQNDIDKVSREIEKFLSSRKAEVSA